MHVAGGGSRHHDSQGGGGGFFFAGGGGGQHKGLGAGLATPGRLLNLEKGSNCSLTSQGLWLSRADMHMAKKGNCPVIIFPWRGA